MFLDLIFGKESPISFNVTRAIWALAFVGSILFIREMSSYLRVYCLLAYAFVFILMLESYNNYGTFFVYPRVFSKLFMLFGVFFVYGFYKKFEEKIQLKQVVNLILIFFVLNVAIVNRDAFSLSAFAAHDRGLSASSTQLLLIPCLFYFNSYFYEKKVSYLFKFLIVIGLIGFLQYRTVWVTAAFGLLANLLFLFKSKIKITFDALIPIAIVGVIIGSIASFFIFSNETIMKKIVENIDDLMNPTSQGTGNWRYVQFQSYWPFVLENPIIGMRFEGFELPVQFFDRDVLAFEDGTGHHFHSNYLDKLFYFGIVGTVFFILPSFIYIFSNLFRIKNLSRDQLALTSFAIAGLVFGISYLWETHYYGTLGLTLFFLDSKFHNKENEEEIGDKLKDSEQELRKVTAI
ncbi:O-antigen ligase family protein [Flexithrix dorotheae]|uniref:O-antigen ligase family protein n=1 Tax=Flexithrix dorotheae TaxID=70993 RepID=UPI0012F7E072|nr:O-antigen ligase family protein [Flexithrix dorotheae]